MLHSYSKGTGGHEVHAWSSVISPEVQIARFNSRSVSMGIAPSVQFSWVPSEATQYWVLIYPIARNEGATLVTWFFRLLELVKPTSSKACLRRCSDHQAGSRHLLSKSRMRRHAVLLTLLLCALHVLRSEVPSDL